ncbi:hypothetical protein ACSLBF_05050 [Pseudoalteromonas sp. T1lg65]|uniref:hypothetical protein n=1 Tax=Pseudoalteromonas sp. T1lg65 TaxID=2077101 RepID=UPI003F7A97B6
MGLTELTQIAKATITSETKSIVTKNKHGFARQVRKLGQPHRWRIKLTTAAMPYPQAMSLYAEVASLDGVLKKTFLPNPLPQIGSAIRAKNAEYAQRGSNNIRVDVITKSAEDVPAFAAGDFVQFGVYRKVYQVTHYDQSSGILTIYPNLKSNLASGAIIYCGAELQFYVYSDDDDTELSISAGRPIPVNVELVEVTE